MIRWLAVITYRSDLGPVDVPHDLEEIADLAELVERGPHWDTIVKIKVDRVNHCTDERLTVERAQTI